MTDRKKYQIKISKFIKHLEHLEHPLHLHNDVSSDYLIIIKRTIRTLPFPSQFKNIILNTDDDIKNKTLIKYLKNLKIDIGMKMN